MDDGSSASFNSQPSHVFRIAGTDHLVMMADRWVPDFVMTKERCESFYRTIYTKKPSPKDILLLMRAPLMGSADTSKARYCYWSQMDNFEWQKGYSMTFGLIAVDRSTQRRTPKESLAFLGSLAK